MTIRKKFKILFVMAILPVMFVMSKSSMSSDVSSSGAEQVEDLSANIMNMSYKKAREAILTNGWALIENAHADELTFATRDMYDQGFVEVGLCSPVGVMPCKFYFENEKGSYLQVATQGEEPRVVSVEFQDLDSYKEIQELMYGE